MEKPLSERYDVVVVGARVAGAATAMLLARHGLSVLLLDRDRLGADTLSTLAMMRAGVLQLHRWGLLERLRAAGTPPIRSTSFFYGDDAITVPIKSRNGVDALYAPRRTVIDPLLAEAARTAGADVRFGPRVTDLVRDSTGRVTGVVVEDRERVMHSVHAGIVIGADGLRSTVARLVDAPIYREGPHTCGAVYAFWRGMENAGNRWYYRPGVSVGAIPSNHGETCVFTTVSTARFHAELHSDMEAGYRRLLEECAPAFAREVLASGAPAERYRGFPGHAAYMRQSHGPGWALVGDAGYFKDPITAHGISDALRDAEFLARAVVRGTDQALAHYQSTRDALSSDLFEMTDRIAAFDWDLPTLQPLHRKLSEAMNHEVEAILALDDSSEAYAAKIAERPANSGSLPG